MNNLIEDRQVKKKCRLNKYLLVSAKYLNKYQVLLVWAGSCDHRHGSHERIWQSRTTSPNDLIYLWFVRIFLHPVRNRIEYPPLGLNA